MYMNASNSGITEERADTSLAIIAQPSLPPLSMAMLAGLVPDPRPTTLRLRLGDTDAGVIDLIPDQYAELKGARRWFVTHGGRPSAGRLAHSSIIAEGGCGGSTAFCFSDLCLCHSM